MDLYLHHENLNFYFIKSAEKDAERLIIEHTFDKPLKFHSKMECELLTLSLPRKLFEMKTNENPSALSFFVCLNIIKDSFVNNQLKKVLALVNWEQNKFLFNNFRDNFCPLIVDELSTIKISIEDIKGKDYAFKNNSIVVGLVFRPIQKD